jgi:hypothetical protein
MKLPDAYSQPPPVEIEGIGHIENRVVAEPSSYVVPKR